MNLTAIGTIAFDSVETPYDRRDKALGGSATYFAAAASSFCEVGVVGVVGTDFPDENLSRMRDLGVDCRGVEVAEGETFSWGGRYEADWNTRHTMFTELNVFEHFDPKVPADYRNAEFVFLANAEPRLQQKALDQYESPALVVADTMNLWIDIAQDDLRALLGRIDGLVLNDEEARMLTGEKNLLRAAKGVLALGPKFVVLKKGEHGAFLIGEDVHFSLPAYPVEEVVDPTGAGDSFAGGFMGYLTSVGDTQPHSLRRAMLYGTATASFCVEGFSIDELETRRRPAVEERFNDLLSVITL